MSNTTAGCGPAGAATGAGAGAAGAGASSFLPQATIRAAAAIAIKADAKRGVAFMERPLGWCYKQRVRENRGGKRLPDPHNTEYFNRPVTEKP
jgi:hypothetical protein